MGKSQIIFLPQNCIDEVVQEFLDEQRKRLKYSSYIFYEDIINDFHIFLNEYGYTTLNSREKIIYKKRYNKKEGIWFTSIFGPEKLVENAPDFVNYQLYNGSRNEREYTGRVIKRLASWLGEKGYISGEQAKDMFNVGVRAVKEMFAAIQLLVALQMKANASPNKFGEIISSVFEIQEIKPKEISLKAPGFTLTLEVPKNISDIAHPGWKITLTAGKIDGKWHIIDAEKICLF